MSARISQFNRLISREVEVTLQETIWDAPILCFLPELSTGLSRGSSFFLLISIILNVLIQGAFCTILFFDPSFTSTTSLTDKIQQMKRWRVTTGHDVAQMDMAGTSLVSRVCGQDSTLSVATIQVAIIEEIRRYLNWVDSDHDTYTATTQYWNVAGGMAITLDHPDFQKRFCLQS